MIATLTMKPCAVLRLQCLQRLALMPSSALAQFAITGHNCVKMRLICICSAGHLERLIWNIQSASCCRHQILKRNWDHGTLVAIQTNVLTRCCRAFSRKLTQLHVRLWSMRSLRSHRKRWPISHFIRSPLSGPRKTT